MENATRFLKQAFNIREGRAPYHVIRKRFVNGARLTGSHLCILIIAMLIASIGLDIDSDIAIVGAMLICPLMGSVLAMAYGIATLDREIAVEAIAGLALQMVFCLITSTLYFKLSPLGTTTAAIIDNSTPTVWDLAVALAGGFAGGLGNSRDQEPATLIAGVAVATALMPPLCAAGYGIAIASGSLFLSALYEFGINVVFIALAAEAVLLLLRVPLKRDLNGDGIVTAEENAEVDELSHKVRRRIIVGTVIFAIPCIVMTAGSIGSAQAGVQDGYGVTETTRELAAVLPGFKDYTVAVETSATEGEEEGLVTARKKDSQDICFVPDGDYAKIIAARTGKEPQPGPFLDLSGNVVGTHRGIIHYTVGQRRGLRMPSDGKIYVVRILPEQNAVVVGPDSALYTNECFVANMHWISGEAPAFPYRCSAKTRYRQPERLCTVYPAGQTGVRLVFDEPLRAITPGQSAVLYDGDTVLGGGIIAREDAAC